jgi:hypothetical protein
MQIVPPDGVPQSIVGPMNERMHELFESLAVEEHHGNQNFVVHFQGVDGTRFRREIVLGEDGTSLHFRSQPGVIWTSLAI